jgi:hypothetical protein
VERGAGLAGEGGGGPPEEVHEERCVEVVVAGLGLLRGVREYAAREGVPAAPPGRLEDLVGAGEGGARACGGRPARR